MKVYKYSLGELSANCYVLVNEETNEGVAIDIGGNEKYLALEELKNNFKIKAILLTHGHIDHINGVKYFKDRGAKVYISEQDNICLTDTYINLADMFQIDFTPFSADYLVKNNEILDICGIKIKVILTPGHTEGSVCYLTEYGLFSGDTLFCGSFGRTDFPTGDFNKLKNSIKKLFTLNENINVYAGHNEPTTIKIEKLNNPINNYD